jgi:Protein of unknown function (DUF3795)
VNYEHMTAPCGLPCFDCAVHLADKDPELRARLAKHLGLPPEQVGCPGCREVKGKCPILPMSCSVFPCAEKKGVKFCYECADFPCDALHPYADQALRRPHNLKVFNLCLIKKMGLEAWAQNKAKSVSEVYFKGKFKL